MEVLYVLIIGLFILLLLIGIKDGIHFLLSSLAEYGGKFTILLIVFFCLLFSPSFVKYYAPEYYGYSVWALILYSVGVLSYYRLFKKTKRIDKNLEG